MTKKELVVKLAAKHNVTKRKASEILDTAFAEIASIVLDGGKRMVLRPFGTFYARDVRRTGRNSDGTKWTRPARKAVAFTPHLGAGGGQRGDVTRVTGALDTATTSAA